MHIKNVLVPVDFSPPSRLAVDNGIALARKFRATLTLMHVVESPRTLTHPVESDRVRIEKQHREQAERMLSALLAPEDQDDLDLRIVLKSGDIEHEISSVISEQRADVVVLGTHGRGLFGRLLIGSVTQSLLRNVPIPILTVCRITPPLALKRILVATDFSEPSKCGLGFALELARTTRSNLLLLHVAEKVSLTYGNSEVTRYVEEHNKEEAHTKLAELAAESKTPNVKIETALAEGNAAQEILKAAEENSVDLILITVQRKGLLEKVLLGTTAERVIREAHVPVLSIPAAGKYM